ncbi:MAG: hypothetical protein E7J75_00750 [Blautia sp.]|nr:hypothetical protein [Blautia sp.]
MELLNFLKQVPLPILILVIGALLIVTLIMTFQYCKVKGLEGIRMDVYKLILKAEHIYNKSGQGKQKLKWVVSQARGLLPKWLQLFITDDDLMILIDKWFRGVKDLLDDGKVNGSYRQGEK